MSAFWRCPVEGCRCCGAGYGSAWQANKAMVRHLARAHRPLLERTPGVAR